MQHRGVVDAVPGLYVIGRDFMYAVTSATLPGVTRDAAHLARRMRARRPRAVDDEHLDGAAAKSSVTRQTR